MRYAVVHVTAGDAGPGTWTCTVIVGVPASAPPELVSAAHTVVPLASSRCPGGDHCAVAEFAGSWPEAGDRGAGEVVNWGQLEALAARELCQVVIEVPAGVHAAAGRAAAAIGVPVADFCAAAVIFCADAADPDAYDAPDADAATASQGAAQPAGSPDPEGD